jgi:PAS domain S-box-containing protein
MPRLFSINNPKAICLAYLIVGIAWIIFSDKAAEYIFSHNIRGMSRFQLYKGIFYVLVTCLMLYYLIRKLVSSINKRKQELELVFANPNLGILKLDAEGLFTDVSDNITRITGYSAADLIGKHINHYTPEDRKEEDLVVLQRIAESEADDGFIFNKHMLSREGEEIIIRGYAMRIKPGKNQAPGYIVAFQNTTEEARFLDALEASNRQLREIASDQSHLVRAPLARILGITNLIQNPGDLSQNEMLTLIQSLEVSAKELDLALIDISQKMNSNPV